MIVRNKFYTKFYYLFLLLLFGLTISCIKKIYPDTKKEVYINIKDKKIKENTTFQYEIINNTSKKYFFIMETDYTKIDSIKSSSDFFSYFYRFVLIGRGGNMRLSGLNNTPSDDDIDFTEEQKKEIETKKKSFLKFDKEISKKYIILDAGHKIIFSTKFSKKIFLNKKNVSYIEYLVEENEKYKIFIDFNAKELPLNNLGNRDKVKIDSLTKNGYQYYKGVIVSNIVQLER